MISESPDDPRFPWPAQPRGDRDPGAFRRASESGGTAHETRDIHRLLVDSVREYAIFALDRTGHVLTWNAGAERLKQYTPDEIIGRHFSTFYPQVDIDAGKPERELEDATRDGSVEDQGWRLRKDGSRFWANVVITALRDDSGELVGFAKVTRDLTERRRAEDALRESEQRFRLLVSSVRDYAIFMLDPAGYVASWNEGAQRIKGYTADEIIGRHFSTFYTQPDKDRNWPAQELQMAIRDGRYEEEGWRVRKDGTLMWANVVITALRDETGMLVGFAKVTRDLTERRAATERAIENARRLAAEEAARTTAESKAQELADLAERLRVQAAELERERAAADHANRAKSDFLAAMSHELRTPLNAIGGYAEIMSMELRGPLTDEQRQDLDRIRRSQQHLLGIINDILNFSRLEAGQLTYDVGPVQLAALFESVAALIEPQASAKQIRYVASDCPPNVVASADRAKIEQILVNLLSNAVKFTPAGGSITLSCETLAGDNRVALRVRDTGVGIPADRLDDIFEPFVQVGRSLTSSAEGTGLGLAISRDLARGMGGDLTAESVEGVGSTFTVTLPRAT